MAEVLPSASPASTGCRFTVEPRGHFVVVAVIGDLDPTSARILIDVIESAAGTYGTNCGIEVDLRRVGACSSSGVRALTECAELGAGLRGGLHFRVGIFPEPADSHPGASATMPG